MHRPTGPRTAAPSQSIARRDATERQNLVLLRAHQTAHPVLYHGVRRFISTLLFHKPGGATLETVVYLMGSPDPVPPEELTPDPDYLNQMLGAQPAEANEEKEAS